MLESTRLSEQKAAVSKKLRSDRFAVMTGQEDDFAQRQGEVRAMYDQSRRPGDPHRRGARQGRHRRRRPRWPSNVNT